MMEEIGLTHRMNMMRINKEIHAWKGVFYMWPSLLGRLGFRVFLLLVGIEFIIFSYFEPLLITVW